MPEKDERFVFSIKTKNSEINIPFKVFIGIIGGMMILSLVKAARCL